MSILRQFFCKEITGRLQPLPVVLIKYIWKCRLVRQSVLNGSKKRIYDAEYGYDMNNNVCYNSGRDHIYIFYTCRRYHWDRG